jgi:hypothetical protein
VHVGAYVPIFIGIAATPAFLQWIDEGRMAIGTNEPQLFDRELVRIDAIVVVVVVDHFVGAARYTTIATSAVVVVAPSVSPPLAADIVVPSPRPIQAPSWVSPVPFSIATAIPSIADQPLHTVTGVVAIVLAFVEIRSTILVRKGARHGDYRDEKRERKPCEKHRCCHHDLSWKLGVNQTLV